MRVSNRKTFAALFILFNAAAAFGYLTDTSVYAPPSDYTNPKLPAVGKKYRDPVFGASGQNPDWISRITDARNTPRVDTGGNLAFISQEYSTTSPFNSDRTRLLLIHVAYFALYDGDGNFVRNLLEVCPTCAPRWSRTNPDVFYYIRGLQIYQYNARTNVHSAVSATLNYERVFSRGEDDICFDGDHLVGFGLRSGLYYVYVFSISQARVVAELNIGSNFGAVDSVQIAPDDTIVISFASSGGIWAYGISGSTLVALRQLSTVDGHHDVGKDIDGSAILLMSNANDPQPICQNGVVKIKIANPNTRQCLLSLHWTLALHISLPDQGGWAFVSPFAPGDPIYGSLSRKEEQNPSVRANGTWTLASGATFSGGAAEWSATPGSQVNYFFYGTKINWIGYRTPDSGIAQVTLDGTATTVDLYSASPTAQVVFTQDHLPVGFHTLTIDAPTSKNALSTGLKVWIDALEDDTPWVTYTNEILQVKLDGTEVRRLLHHRSRPFNTYTYQPKVAASRDGKRLVWASNFGIPAGAYNDYADTYMMMLDKTR